MFIFELILPLFPQVPAAGGGGRVDGPLIQQRYPARLASPLRVVPGRSAFLEDLFLCFVTRIS